MPRNDDLEELRGLVDIYGQYKKTKAEAEKARLEVQLWWRQAQQEIELARKRAEQGLELERLERLSKLSLEVLVLAARTPEQARLVEGLARLNTMKGLSPETIMVLAADRDPRLAEAFLPVLLNIHQAGKADEYRQLMERLIAMQKEGADRTREDYQQTLRTFTQMFERFADTTVEVARAAAGREEPSARQVTPPIEISPQVIGLVEGDIARIQEVVIKLATEEARARAVRVQRILMNRVDDPEEEWWEIAFDIAVDAVAEDALAYWEGLEKRLEAWAKTQPATIQELLAHRIALSVEWPADATVL